MGEGRNRAKISGQRERKAVAPQQPLQVQGAAMVREAGEGAAICNRC